MDLGPFSAPQIVTISHMMVAFKLLITLILFSFKSLAGMQLGVSVLLFNEANTLSAKNDSSTVYFDALAYLQVWKDQKVSVGVEYQSYTFTGPNAASAQTSLSADGVILGVRKYFGSKSILYFGLGYGPIMSARYQISGAGVEAWTGTQTTLQIGIRPRLTNKLFVKAAMSFTQVSYTSKTLGASATPSSTNSSFSQTYYLPMLGLEYAF